MIQGWRWQKEQAGSRTDRNRARNHPGRGLRGLLSHGLGAAAAVPGSPFNDAFVEAMRPVYHANPTDLDVASIFAEALMGRTPWQLWDFSRHLICRFSGDI